MCIRDRRRTHAFEVAALLQDESVKKQLRLAVVVGVHRGLGDSGQPRHFGDVGLLVTELDEEGARGAEDLIAARPWTIAVQVQELIELLSHFVDFHESEFNPLDQFGKVSNLRENNEIGPTPRPPDEGAPE